MAAHWSPDIDSFFDSLVRVIRGARAHLSTNQVDSAEFWCRRLDEYERTLRLLLARMEESRSDLTTFVRDLEILLDALGNLREALDARSLHGDFQIDRQDTPSSLSSVDRTEMGRPRLIIGRIQVPPSPVHPHEEPLTSLRCD